MPKSMPKHLLLYFVLLLVSGCGPKPTVDASVMQRPVNGNFKDITKSAGLSFQYINDASPAHRFVETTGGGCAFVDFDNDGRLDIFAVQGGPAPGSPQQNRPKHALYRNLGNGKFEDVTEKAGLAVDVGYAQGVAAGDYDNDGWTDILITSYGGIHLFRNDHGHFVDVTKRAGLIEQGEPHWSTSAAWGDYDRDGHLDLFVCHYASWFIDVDRPCVDSNGRRMYCSPTDYPGDVSTLYHNNGDGTFKDVTKPAGLSALSGRAMSAAWLDFDDDGWPDLFVSNDMHQNWLLRNNRNGTFTDVASNAGVSNGPEGRPLSGMGIAVADFNGDGGEDLFVVNFSLQPRSYFLREGKLFRWATGWAGLGDATQPFLAFGVESLDYDLDGHPDLVIGNGHINENVDLVPGEVTYKERQQLLRNLGDGRFIEDAASAADLNEPRVTRGIAVGDFDNDGRPDVLTNGPASPLSLFHNEVKSSGNWIGFRLEGKRSNRDGIGAKVTINSGPGKQIRVVRSGSSYCSHSDIRPLFGLGKSSSAVSVQIEWPDGSRQEASGLVPGRYYLVRQGSACEIDPRVKR